jgi:CDP-diacylglycerol---glycerol-3-phosphate 3-phosphatidyltransferase
MTEHIKKKLQDEMNALEHELIHDLPKEIKKAAALGDLSENAEYHMAKQRQEFVKARLRQLGRRMADLSLINMDNIPRDKVGLGSTVKIFDNSKNEEVEYKLVTTEEADGATGKISTSSPIGRALLNKKVGDTATVVTPNGKRELDILTLSTTRLAPDMARTWTSAFGRACGKLLNIIVRWLALSRINPNVLTFMGLVVNTIAAILFGYANSDNQARLFRYAGLVIIGSGFFDLVDGEVARATNRVTRFGGFFDSVIDRYSDASQFLGLLVFYARGERFVYVVLAAFVMVSAIMVSYTRARAESLIGSCRVGFLERPERLVLVIIGALFNRMAPVLWLIAVLSTITVIHRMRYTWTRTQDSPATAKGQAA